MRAENSLGHESPMAENACINVIVFTGAWKGPPVSWGVWTLWSCDFMCCAGFSTL